MSRRGFLAFSGTAAVLVLCFWPGWAMAGISEAVPRFPHFDKLVHFSMFTAFGLLWMLSGRKAGVVLAMACALAVVTEMGQGLSMIGRDPDLLDCVADLLGGGAGVSWVSTRRALG